MAALAKRRYTLEEYLELEKHAEERYAYCGGEVVAMSGASLRHNRIVRNLMRAIDARLEGKSCEILPTDMRIKVPKALPYRYADLVVVCGEPVIEDMQGLEVLVNPPLGPRFPGLGGSEPPSAHACAGGVHRGSGRPRLGPTASVSYAGCRVPAFLAIAR